MVFKVDYRIHYGETATGINTKRQKMTKNG